MNPKNHLVKQAGSQAISPRSLEQVQCFPGSSFGMLCLMLCLLICVSLYLPSSAAPPVAKTAKPESFIELKAKTSLFGNVTFLIAKQQVVTRCFTGSTIWNSRKAGQVQLVHPEAGCYFNMATKDWIKKKRAGIDGVSIARVVTLGEEKLAKQTCVHYRGYESKEVSKAGPSIEFWSIAKPPCDKETIDYVCKYFCVPSQYGLPIKVKQLHDGAFGATLTPITFEIRALRARDFTMPSGYRQVKDIGAFYFAEKGDSLEASELNSYFRTDRSERSDRSNR